MEGTVLISNEDRMIFTGLKNAFRFRKVQFSSIEASYTFEEIYNSI